MRDETLVSCSRNKHVFRCDQNGPPARREEGAYLERYVTDEQGSRRPIFIATLWAAASWLFFRIARSSRIDLDMLVARALKNSQLTCGERHAYFGNRTLTPAKDDRTANDMSASTITLTLLLLATIAAVHSDHPTFWLLIGPAPLASGLTALTFLRRK